MLPVRSTVSIPPRIYMENHAFNARTVTVESTPASAFPLVFFAGCSATSVLGAFRTRNVELICFASGLFKKS